MGIRPEFQLHITAVTVPAKKERKKISAPINIIAVDRAVWDAAIASADGDALRIEVISSTHVIVHNSRGWKR